MENLDTSMLKKSTNYLNLISIIILVYLAFIPLQPHNIKKTDVLVGGFQMKNVYKHLDHITKAPHYIGSDYHRSVKSYLIRQLQILGFEVTVQKTTISNQSNTYSQVENIIAKIDGSEKSRKSLLLMSHYDSVDFASVGAADAGSGVAVILEGIRIYLEKGIQPKNDIIILFTDAEEEGLLGAKAFVNKHRWADNIGAVMNFEARGSSGSSYMIMETNAGNQNLLDAYNTAGLLYPSSNSLAYSIYKLLPNDTDLSVFRKDKNIVGYNFAFIDDHFNYHTVLDNIENLSTDSLAQQAFYLMPMLNKLSEVDLTSLQSNQDDVYFQLPFFKTLSYSFDWALTISLVNLLIFLLVIGIGIKNQSLRVKAIFTGGFPLFKALITTALLCFALLKFLYWLHPHYVEILQGFPYNGSAYLLFFSLLTIAICLFFYRKLVKSHSASELMVFPIFLWLLVSLLSALYLTGAHFFILISITGTVALTINVLVKKPQSSLTLLLFAPIILIFAPFFMQIPVALGLMAIPASSLLLALFFSTFISSVQIPKQFQINTWLIIAALLGSYIYAETQASFNQQRPLPNSLYYFQDNESALAYWLSFDYKADKWSTQFFKQNQLDPKALLDFNKKHYPWAKMAALTDNKNIASSKIEVLFDRRYSDKHIYKLKITPQRNVNILNLLNNKQIHLLKLSINRQLIYQGKPKLIKKKQRLARIYNANEVNFIIEIEIAADEQLDLYLLEMSPDLMTSKILNIPPRSKEFIPKAFVLSDSIITKQRVDLSE